MYKTYRIRIKPISSYITPWQSDTIIGHLFWAIKYRFGEERLKEILNEAKNGNPLFILSDAFPTNVFPKFNMAFDFGKLNIQTDEEYTRFKEIKKEKLLTLEQFNKFLQGYPLEEYYKSKMLQEKKDSFQSKFLVNSMEEKISVTHNTINRLKGATIDGGVFNINETYTGDTTLDIFIKVKNGYDIEELKTAFEDLEKNGFGKKNSSGKGAFEIVDNLSEFKDFSEPKTPNAYIILSNYIPKVGDYEEILYSETLTKYGKLGGDYALGELPFKKPFICFIKGSIFKSNNLGVKGKVLENLHYNSDIIQFGFPFILGVKIDE